MTNAVKYTAVAFIFLILGLAGGASLFATSASPSDEHYALASAVIVHDNTLSQTYTAVCTSSAFTVALEMIPLEFSGVITQSSWEFRSDTDDPTTTYAVMSIYGPGSNGEFFLQIARLTPDSLTVTYPGGPVGGYTFSQGGNDGYVYAIV